MPKKILNLEEKIFTAAWDLFSNYGYDVVDMKAIAKECKIAVGTLYNYYGNKKELFIKVLEASWENTFNKIEEIIESNNDRDKSIRKIIEILYLDIKERRGIGSNLLKSEGITKSDNEKVEDKIINKLFIYILKTFNIDGDKNNIEYKAEKITHIILCNIVLLARMYPQDDEENIKFLINIVNDNLK